MLIEEMGRNEFCVSVWKWDILTRSSSFITLRKFPWFSIYPKTWKKYLKLVTKHSILWRWLNDQQHNFHRNWPPSEIHVFSLHLRSSKRFCCLNSQLGRSDFPETWSVALNSKEWLSWWVGVDTLVKISFQFPVFDTLVSCDDTSKMQWR